MINFKIEITNEMRQYALIEAKKRNAYIKHHFELDYMSPEERDQVGFLGEFASCKLFNLDWKSNIRDNYETIDDFDFKIGNLKVDVKTETLKKGFAEKILNGTIDDDKAYGARLINKNQLSLLKKYDIVIFSLFIREDMDYWYPIGYLESKIILENYPVRTHNPSGAKYPSPASAIPNSHLKPISNFFNKE